MPSIRGTASVTDPRARSKALKATKFPSNFVTSVNLNKVNQPVMKQWIEEKVTSILGFDDEIVSSLAINLFLPSEGGCPDPRRAQLDLGGFLGEDEAASFAKELWSLLLEAQSSPSGIPRTLIEQKKKAVIQKAVLPKLPPNMQPASNRNPEINRFVQEAARRAQAARQMVDAQPAAVVELAAAAFPQPNVVPVPVSPPHPSEQPDRKLPPKEEEDRKLSPARDRYGRAVRDAPLPPAGRGRYDDRPRRPHASARSSRSRERRSEDPRRSHSRSIEHDGRVKRRSRERRRYYNSDEEIEELEGRLTDLKRQFSKRRDDRNLDDEIEDVKDRIYELERRRRRARRRQEEEERERRKRRRRESPDRRRRRSRSSESDDSRHRRRSRSRSGDRRRGREREVDEKRDRREGGDERTGVRRDRSPSRSYSSSESDYSSRS